MGKQADVRTSSLCSVQIEGEHSDIALDSSDTQSEEESAVTADPELFACDLKKDPKPCSEFREDTVDDLKEQISQLMAMLEQERRDYRLVRNKLKTKHKEDIEQLIQTFREEVRKLQKVHAEELQGVVTRELSAMEEQKKAMEQKLVEAKKELERLKITFRAYKDSLLNKMNEKWKMLEAQLHESQKEEKEQEKEKSLVMQNQKFMETSKKERNDLWLRAQKQICEMQQQHLEAIKDLNRKYEVLQRDYQHQKSEKEAMQSKLAEKEAELQVLKKATEENQRQVEQLKKNLAGVQKNCEEKMRNVEAQYRRSMQTMRHDNADLRRRRSTVIPTSTCVTSSVNEDGKAAPRPRLLFMPPACCYQIYRPPRKCLL